MNDLVATSEGALAVIAKAEIDMQITTAKQYPRSIKLFMQQALDMATLDEVTAQSCFYALPRDGKTISGPSVRLAEIVASAWGNLRFGARIVGQDARFITAQGVCHDLQTNVAATIEVQRRITNKSGKTFGDDMIGVTGNAACSIALRNAVFKVIPGAYWKAVYDQALRVAQGTESTLAARREKALGWFKAKHKVEPPRLLALLGKKGVEDIGAEELLILTGLRTALNDGDTTLDEVFAVRQPDAAPLQAGRARITNGHGKPVAVPQQPIIETPRQPDEDNQAAAAEMTEAGTNPRDDLDTVDLLTDLQQRLEAAETPGEFAALRKEVRNYPHLGAEADAFLRAVDAKEKAV